MSRKITESTAEQCVWFLMDSCDAHAEAKGAVIAAENAIKRAKAEVYLETSGTVAERDAKVTLNSQVRDAAFFHGGTSCRLIVKTGQSNRPASIAGFKTSGTVTNSNFKPHSRAYSMAKSYPW